MKHLILASSVFFLLIAGLAVASSEMDERWGVKDIEEGNPDFIGMTPTKSPSEESEFSAMESDRQTESQSGKASDDVYDYTPASWDIP
ncbi:MAG: hypothetical protein V3R49_06840 [Gammaproteobacteria bacterium]